MRSRILLVISAMFVLGIGIAVYAFNTTGTETAAAACCCCAEACPMKKGEKAAASTASTTTADQKTAGEHSCCGDSCPMKGAAKTTDGKAAGHTCCKGEGASCPMKKGDKAAGHAGMNHDMKAGDASCPMMKGAKTEAKAADSMKHKMTGDDHAAMDHSKMDGHSCACPCCSGKEKQKEAKTTDAI